MLSVKRQTLIAGLVGGLCLFLVLGSTRSGHTELISTPARARQMMLRGLGSGPEEESGQDWEVAMALDKGCERQQRERKEGNLAWGRYAGAEPCIPAKRSNPMMWPFDVPGKTWARGEDGSYASDSEGAEQRGKEEWPYNHADLHRYVASAETEMPTIDLSDGVFHWNPPQQNEEPPAATASTKAARLHALHRKFGSQKQEQYRR